MAKRMIAGILLVMLFICGGTAVASGCEDEYGNPVPCEQDPGGGESALEAAPTPAEESV